MGLYVSQPLDRLQVLEERISYLERQLQETPSSTTIIENDFEKVEKKVERPKLLSLHSELVNKIKERRKIIEVDIE
tara:strand:- start:231 stop:458 length:228 start_codon:yes stop_codon:yes gene_type:complete